MVIGILAFALLIGLVSLALNSFDVPLSAEAKTLLATPASPYRPDDNLYVAFAGFDASSKGSIVDTGTARIEAYNAALDSILLNPAAAISIRQPASTKLAFKGDLASWKPLSSSIWTAVKSHRADIAGLLASNQELYQRYRSLHQLHGYWETARPSYFMPSVYLPQSVRILFLADIANRIQTGTLQQKRDALTELSQDLRLWKFVLKGNGDLSSKMIASASLQADLLLLGDMIADADPELALLDAEQAAAISQFEPADWKIGNVFGAEFRMRAAHFMASRPFEIMPSANAAAPETRSWPGRLWQRLRRAFTAHFFKVNAAMNESAAQMLQLAALANSDPARFSQARVAYRQWLDQNEMLVSPAVLYDPIGKILVGTAALNWDDFPLRVYDVAALQRLVFLAYQLRAQRISPVDVASFLSQHPEWSAHPVDDRRFVWNSATGELAVTTVVAHPCGQRFSTMIHEGAGITQAR
jgi:hypothetical protein